MDVYVMERDMGMSENLYYKTLHAWIMIKNDKKILLLFLYKLMIFQVYTILASPATPFANYSIILLYTYIIYK